MLKTTRRAVGAVTLTFAMVVSACGSDDDAADEATTTSAASAPIASGDVHTVTEADSGGTFTMDPGDILHVELENCATCGYEWTETTSPDENVLTITEHHLIEPDRSQGMVGGMETALFTYQAIASGTASIDLGYHSPSGDLEKTFTLTVTVT